VRWFLDADRFDRPQGTQVGRRALGDAEGIRMLRALPTPELENCTRTVLVVEDDVLIRMMIADELRQTGFRVVEASSGDEALRCLASGYAVDLIFTDVQMPGKIDGAALARLVARDYPEIRVFVTSAHGRMPHAGLAAQFIPKPYIEGDVVRRIIDALATP
jgi:CheY-like chemotaxis protein